MTVSANPRTLLLMILLNALATPVMLSASNVALPSIALDLNMNATQLSWIPMAFLMSSAMFVVILSRVSDRFGRKRVFLIGTAAMIVSSLFTAVAPNSAWLLIGRFLQGLSAAMLHANQMALVSAAYPPETRGRMIGLVVSFTYVGLSAGPLLGGLVVDALGWRAAFVLQVPMAVLVLALGIFVIREEWRTDDAPRFDAPGALGWLTSIALLCLGISWLPQWQAGVIIVGGLLVMALFFIHARRVSDPLWEVDLFFTHRVFRLSSLASLLMYTATYAIVVLMSLYLQTIQSYSAAQAGMILMIQPLIMALLSPVAGRMSDRVEPRVLASAGMVVTALGLLMLSHLQIGSSLMYIVAALVLTGTGFSLFSSPNINAIMSSVESRHSGSASSAVATMRLLGQLSSMVLVTLSIALIMGNTPVSPETAPQLARAVDLSFTLGALLCIPGILLSLARGRLHNKL
jgi:EmrB/QacA subfamily drug resistance transporter